MLKGTADRYSEQKGFGYIIQDDGKKIFVERSSIDMTGYKTLAPGDRVSFEMGKGIRGPVAKKVKKIW